MVRSTLILLLFAVFFLLGIVFGVNQNASHLANESHFENEKEYVYEDTIKDEEIGLSEIEKELEEVNDESKKSETSPQALTMSQKAASFIEMGVKGFYDIVVEIIYQFTKLFFK